MRRDRAVALLYLAATVSALSPSVLKIRTVRLRTRKVFAQSRDEVLQSSTSIGRMNYYNQQGGQSPAAAAASQQNYGEVLWRIAKAAGVAGFNFFVDENLVYHGLPYTLRAGDEQVLSRWNMLEQKLTVSRVQAVVQVLADGTALLESRGKAPTLWRACGGPWYALNRGEQAPLADGDQVSLDPYNPEAAVFTCHDERALQQGGYQQSGYQQGGVGQNQRYYVQATCDYAAEQAGYLGFRLGEVIEVLQQGEPGGWWEGALYDQVGWFPSSFCSEPFYQ